jgi:hypothetical protein
VGGEGTTVHGVFLDVIVVVTGDQPLTLLRSEDSPCCSLKTILHHKLLKHEGEPKLIPGLPFCVHFRN